MMLADALSSAVLAPARDTAILSDAHAPAVLTPVPAAVMLADARAPTVLAAAPLASHTSLALFGTTTCQRQSLWKAAGFASARLSSRGLVARTSPAAAPDTPYS